MPKKLLFKPFHDPMEIPNATSLELLRLVFQNKGQLVASKTVLSSLPSPNIRTAPITIRHVKGIATEIPVTVLQPWHYPSAFGHAMNGSVSLGTGMFNTTMAFNKFVTGDVSSGIIYSSAACYNFYRGYKNMYGLCMNEIITSGEILLDTVGTLLTSNISEIQKFCAVLFSNSEEKRAFFICVLSFMEKTQIEEIHGIESGDVTEEIENTIELFISILMID